MLQQPPQNPDAIFQEAPQSYAPQTQQTYNPYEQVPRGGLSQGYVPPGTLGYTEPQVRHRVFSST